MERTVVQILGEVKASELPGLTTGEALTKATELRTQAYATGVTPESRKELMEQSKAYKDAALAGVCQG